MAAEPTELDWRNIDDLEVWEDNPNEGDIGGIITSILRFGFQDELNVWAGEIMAGNHRKKALLVIRAMHNRGEDRERIDTAIKKSKRLRVDEGIWQVSVCDISHLDTREEAIGYALAENQTGRRGRDNPNALIPLLEALRGCDLTIYEATGFDDDLLNDAIEQMKRDGDYTGAFEDKKTVDDTSDDFDGGGADFMIYVSFKDEDEFFRGLKALSLGDRTERREGTRYAALDGTELLADWEKIVGQGD